MCTKLLDQDTDNWFSCGNLAVRSILSVVAVASVAVRPADEVGKTFRGESTIAFEVYLMFDASDHIYFPLNKVLHGQSCVLTFSRAHFFKQASREG